MPNITYDAPPTVARFIKSESFGRLVAGPVGSGKTTGCLFELFRRASEQHHAPDGIRHTRFAIVRQTLKQLKDTVLKDITSWLNPVCTYKVSDNTVYVRAGDIDSEWLLIPLEDPEDRARLLSMQLTGAWMSEAIEMDVNVIPDLSGRCGRYPGAALGGARWSGIIADTNFPSEGSDWHKFMEETPIDWQMFKQPGGLSQDAENLQWLNQTVDTLKLPVTDPARLARGRAYYERLARNTNPDWVKRYVHAQYGNDPSGTAVFRDTFDRSVHVVDNLEPVAGHPLIIGQDFGRDPWSIICQLDHQGCLRVLEEVPAEDTSLQLHLSMSLRPRITQERYLGKAAAIIGDPAGMAKDSLYEETSFDMLKRMGFQAFPAPTNDLDPRIRAVDAFLLLRNGMKIDRARCPELIKALSGEYKYEKTKAGQRKPVPAKNAASHRADALQYACLAAHGGMTTMITNRLQRRPRSTVPRIPKGAWT